MKRFIAVLITLLILATGVLAANSIASTQIGSTIPAEIISSAYIDIAGNNASISTGSGEMYVQVFIDSRTSYSRKPGSAQIKIDGVVVNAMNLSALTSYTPDSFMAHKTVTEGTHYAELEVKAYSGKKLYIRSWKMTVQFLKTGEYLLGATTITNETINPYSVNAANLTGTANYSVIPALPQGNVSGLVGTLTNLQMNDTTHDSDIAAIQSNETGYITNSSAQITEGQVTNLVTDLTGKEPAISAGTSPQFWFSNKTWQNITTSWVTEGTNLFYTSARAISALSGINLVQNNSISGLQSNDTADRTYVNNTFLPISTYSGDFPNSTVGAKEAVWNGKTTLNEVNSSAQISEPQVTNLVSDLAGKESTITGGTNNVFWNGLKQWISLGIGNITGLQAELDNKLAIATYSGDFPNNTVASKEAAWDAKEPAISTSTASKFYSWDKTFRDITAGFITDFVTAVRTNISSTSGLVAYNSGTGVISDSINSSAQIGSTTQVTGLDTALAGKTTLDEVNSSADLYNVNGSNVTSGTVADARIASTISRDTEVAALNGVKIKPFVFVIGSTSGLQNMVFKAPYALTIGRVDTYIHGTGTGNITYQLWKNTTAGFINGNPVASDSVFTGSISNGRYAVNTSISQIMVANDTIMVNVSVPPTAGATIELEITV